MWFGYCERVSRRCMRFRCAIHLSVARFVGSKVFPSFLFKLWCLCEIHFSSSSFFFFFAFIYLFGSFSFHRCSMFRVWMATMPVSIRCYDGCFIYSILVFQFIYFVREPNRTKKKKKEYYEDMYPPIRTCHIACRIRWWFCQVVRAMLVLIVSICIRLTSNRRRFFLPTVRRFADFASIQPHNINNNSSGGSCSEIPICNCIW